MPPIPDQQLEERILTAARRLWRERGEKGSYFARGGARSRHDDAYGLQAISKQRSNPAGAGIAHSGRNVFAEAVRFLIG